MACEFMLYRNFARVQSQVRVIHSWKQKKNDVTRESRDVGRVEQRGPRIKSGVARRPALALSRQKLTFAAQTLALMLGRSA